MRLFVRSKQAEKMGRKIEGDGGEGGGGLLIIFSNQGGGRLRAALIRVGPQEESKIE